MEKTNKYNNEPRPGCTDMWNAFLVKNAEFTIGSDMPVLENLNVSAPTKLVSYDDAKQIYKKRCKSDKLFHVPAFIHFYIDDQKFDGKRSSIWLYPFRAWEVLHHFDGFITPDFSTNIDFPDSLKRYNTFRMRAFGFWGQHIGLEVIHNVRWGSPETWNYCFDGIPKNSIVAIGTVASGLKKVENRPIFESGFYRMLSELEPHTIIVYGSASYPCFDEARRRGIRIIVFPSKTSIAFGGNNE